MINAILEGLMLVEPDGRIVFVNRALEQCLQLKTGKTITGISKGVMEQLLVYEWAGSVLEHINAVEYAFVLFPQGERICEHLPRQDRRQGGTGCCCSAGIYAGGAQQEERRKLLKAFQESGGIKTAAARPWWESAG